VADPRPDVAILCGGLGTRLQSVLSDRPKPMAPVDGKPFLDILIDHALGQGFRRFVLLLGHKAGAVREHYARDARAEFVFSEEPRPLGTAGAVKLAAPLLRGGELLLMNGDSFCALDLNALLAARRGSLGAIAVTPAAGRADAGFVAADADGRIVSFSEKGREGVTGLINAGVYALDREVLDAVPAGEPCSLELTVFPSLLGRGLYAHRVEQPVHDIGTPERLEAFRRSRGRAA
jgi:NDP-sugar pyrophosphorylase family protein